MGGLLSYILSKANLEKSIQGILRTETEESMNRIRRHICINGESVWVTAKTEQEYAEKVAKLSQKSGTEHRFEDYALRWFDIFSKPNVDRATALTYERQLRIHIFPVIGDKALESVRTEDVQKIFNRMGDNVKRETKNKVKIVLNQIFCRAIDEELIVKNPLSSPSLRIGGRDSTTTEPYSVEQMQYLAKSLPYISNEIDRAWLALSISLPLRPEEVLGLQWGNLDLQRGFVHICSTVSHPSRNRPEYKPYTKTSSSVRTLVIPREIMTYLPTPGASEDFVIGGKEPLSYTQVRCMRKRIAAEIGFEDVLTPRRFRTTVATDISATTHDLKLVQQMLGHSTPQMTLKHYDKGRSQAIDAADAVAKCYGLTGN